MNGGVIGGVTDAKCLFSLSAYALAPSILVCVRASRV